MNSSKLLLLRHSMREHGIQAYLVPSTDPHQSEYVPALWERRKWLSGFTGSAGDLAITLEKAGLWTDSRYFLQAEEELRGSGITLFKMGLPETPSLVQWLKQELKPESKVGIDPRVFSYQSARKMEEELATRNIQLVSIEENLVDALWEDQPEMPSDPIIPHPEKYSGESVESKLSRLRGKMAEEGVGAHVVTTLDNIAWLYNIRGNDVSYNPVVIAYALVTEREAFLFTPLKKVTEEVLRHLEGQVNVYAYEDFDNHLRGLAKEKIRVWLDPETVNRRVVDLLSTGADLFFRASPVTYFKAVKNSTEIAGMKAAHVRDGVAMVKFLYWLEKTVPQGGVTELSASEKLEQLRAQQDLFRGLSFPTIAAYRDHGAIVHYAPSPESDVELRPEGIFLIDSGGQYLDGTTDITRTVALGEPTPEQKDHFTRILKGNLQLTMTRFPRNTAGNQLDTIARKPLWDIGLNYGHGTGHGVGSYLNVHEGPQGISYYRGIGVALEPGMVLSNEPAFYKEGEYGMRVENMMVVVKDEHNPNPVADFLTFENITWCPIDLRLVEKKLLDEAEIAFLNAYHRRVRELLSPYLEAEEKAWLEKATRPI